jgi:small nuclear ribonucleoprotein (snRNP)-like protein
MNNTNTIEEPLDMVHMSIGSKVTVRCRNDKELKGKLHVKIIL